MARFLAPFTTLWLLDRAHALTDLQGKTSKFLLVYGARAAPRGRGVATLGAGLAPSFVEGFGAYIPDDDPEPDRAKDCPEYVKAEECRAAGCEWTKNTAVCAHWALKNSMGQPKPPPETLTPTNSPTEPDPTNAPTETPTVATGTPSSSPTPPPPSPTGATSTTAAVEPASTTAADEEPETITTTKATSTTTAADEPDEEASTSTTAEQTTTTTEQITTSTTTEQTTTTTAIVVACKLGFKPNGNGSACEACDVAGAANYSSDCIVDTCKAGFNLVGNGSACEDCDVAAAATYSSGCIVATCKTGYELNSSACVSKGWTKVGPNEGAWYWDAITSSANGKHLAATGSLGESAIFVSSDFGLSWELTTKGEYAGITISSEGDIIAAPMEDGKVFMSTDYGKTQSLVGNASDYSAITSSSKGTKLAAVTYGGSVWTSSDSGAEWKKVVPGAPDPGQYLVAITSSSDGSRLAAVAGIDKTGNIWTSSDSGDTWERSLNSSKKWASITSNSDGKRLAAVVYEGNI